MNNAIPEEDYIEAIVNGCKTKGTIGCTGDGVPALIHQSGLQAIKNAGGAGIPFIKPWDDEELFPKLALAAETGTDTIGMDIDAASLISLRLMGRPVSAKSLEKLKEIIERTGKKFILKGIMTSDDAERALQAGADAIVVSNHGGRVLDSTPGTATVLPEIADRISGRLTILVDGGIRTGGDVLKMLALGADCVMIGRPFAIAAVGGLQEGVEKYIETLTTELKQTMIMTGCGSIQEINKNILYNNSIP